MQNIRIAAAAAALALSLVPGMRHANARGLCWKQRTSAYSWETCNPARCRTADNTYPGYGTIAASSRQFRFGTRLRVAGYGRGVVLDRGGPRIEYGRYLDLFFPSIAQARAWGIRRVRVCLG